MENSTEITKERELPTETDASVGRDGTAGTQIPDDGISRICGDGEHLSDRVGNVISRVSARLGEMEIPNAIMAYDGEHEKYAYAGVMPEEIGDGTKYSSMKLDKFVRFLELATDFTKEEYYDGSGDKNGEETS